MAIILTAGLKQPLHFIHHHRLPYHRSRPWYILVMQSSRLNILRCKNKLPVSLNLRLIATTSSTWQIFRQGPSPCLSRRATFHNLTWPQTTSLAHFSSLKPKSKHGLPGSSLNWRHMSTSSGPRPPRFVNARDIYKQRNRTLMMYTSAVVRLALYSFVSICCFSTLFSCSYSFGPIHSFARLPTPIARRLIFTDSTRSRRNLCGCPPLSHVLRRYRFCRYSCCRHGEI